MFRRLCFSIIYILIWLVPSYASVIISTDTFPDEVFRACVSSEFDINHDGILSGDELAGVTSMDNSIFASYDIIQDLKGIEYFTELTLFQCNGKLSVDILDFRSNDKLISIDCKYNSIAYLNVNGLNSLRYINCGYNNMISLDVRNCTTLNELYCWDNQLTALDISKNTALKHLYCYSNQLTALDVSKHTALTWLDCSSNQLTTLDISKHTALTGLYCFNNQLGYIDLSSNTNLQSPYVLISNQNVSGIKAIESTNSDYPYLVELTDVIPSSKLNGILKDTIKVYNSSSSVKYTYDGNGIIYSAVKPSKITIL